MSRILALAPPLLIAAFVFAQQAQPPGQNLPLPSPQASPEQEQPQVHPAHNPQDKASVNSQIQSNIRNVLSGDPVLSGTDVQVQVDDVDITLTGQVQSLDQLHRVMALVSPYSHHRRIVNKVVIH